MANGSQPSFIVGVGASAGGLEPIQQLFDALPAGTGMAFVVIQHLSPDYKSLMGELLSRHTQMPVKLVEGGEPIERNHVYLIPAKHEMVLSDGRFLLTEVEARAGASLPIDIFFRSLAEDAGERAIGIVLSGTGSDGSRGVRAIHKAGGLVIVQDAKSSEFDGMPERSIATGIVDYVVPVAGMAGILSEVSAGHRPDTKPGATATDDSILAQPGIYEIFQLLQLAFDLDFSSYKASTSLRRLDRRMALKSLATVPEYANYLKTHPEELSDLYKDLLIGVTQFFRDKEAFDLLAANIVPQIVQRATDAADIRVWIPGCATGEEAYSLAMLFLEEIERKGSNADIKIYATDVHRVSLVKAGSGIYHADKMPEVSEARRERFFARRGNEYQALPILRRTVIFAPQNVLKDPPFTRMDLISCRNLLIYFDALAQKKVLRLFQFALKPGGFLFLGPSESLGDLSEEFACLNRTWKLFQKRLDAGRPSGLELPAFVPPPLRAANGAPRPAGEFVFAGPDKLLQAYDAILAKHVPSSLLVNSKRELLHTLGAGGKYLRPAGRFSNDLLNMLTGDLKTAVAAALLRATREAITVEFHSIEVAIEGVSHAVNVKVEPLFDRGRGLGVFLVSFAENAEPAGKPASVKINFDADEFTKQRVADLESELSQTKQSLQSAIEELETSNEELQASNEELMASNEELQSTNEELHSLNEELHTVNAEYQSKIAELTQVNADINNLIRSTQIGTVFLDAELRIRRFTSAQADVFNLLPGDAGRPIADLHSNVTDPGLIDDLAKVRSHGEPIEREVRHRNGAWLLLRAVPYVTEAKTRDGVVVTFMDVTRLKELEEQFRVAVEAAPSGMLVVDEDGKITVVNRHLEALFGFERSELLGQSVDMLVPEPLRSRHAEQRREYTMEPEARLMGRSRYLKGRRKDGTEIQVEVGLNPVLRSGRRFIIASVVTTKCQES